MLYHDMQQKIMVSYPGGEGTQGLAKESFDLVKTGEGLPLNVMGDYRFRIVFSQNALREKAMIFNLGLDDRVVELAKHVVREVMAKQHPGHPSLDGEALFYADEGKYFVEFLGKQRMQAVVPEGLVDGLRDWMESHQAGFPEEGYYIDARWADNMMQSQDKA